MTLEGNRNALLALHYGEGDAAGAAAHAEGCAECRAYLQALREIEGALAGWGEEKPPVDLRERVLARATRPAQLPARRNPAAAPSAAPLLAMLPVMAAVVLAVNHLGAYVARWPYWEALAPWLQDVAPFGAVAAALAVAGGVASLAMAPVLVLDSRKS